MSDLRILIVEDESIVAMDLQNRLENFGYTIIGHVVSGREAVEKARAAGPDVILMDIQLKGEMDGIQSAELIKDELDIPVIFLTAFADQPTLERAKLTEAFGYILKPYHERELYTNIEMAIYKHRMEKKVRAHEKWLNTTINSIRDGVITADNEGNIHLVNGPALQITGLSKKEVIGKKIDDVFKQISLFAGDKYGKVRNHFITRNGENFPVEVTETDLRNDKGSHLGKVVVLHDISERYKFEQVLRQAKETAEKASAAKSEFLATISHELRTPLNSILGMTEISLEALGDNDELRENLSIIEKAGNNLLSVINSILQLAQIGGNGGDFGKRETISLKPFITSLFEKHVPRANPKGLLFRGIIHEGTPSEVLGSKGVVFEILDRLLENALKFTEKGEVILHAFFEREMSDSEKAWIHFLVNDTGKGLPAGAADKIFEPFTQGENTYTRSHGGTGLGLTIAKQKAEILGGEIWVDGDCEKGCSFHLLIPYGLASTDFLTTAYVIDNEEERENAAGTKGGRQEPIRVADYVSALKGCLDRDDLKSLERETTVLKELLESSSADEVKEKVLKILLACRRNDKKMIAEELTSLETVEYE